MRGFVIPVVFTLFTGLVYTENAGKLTEAGRTSAGDIESVDELKNSVKFFLYNDRKNAGGSEKATLNSKTLFKGFKSQLPTKIIVHGWRNNLQSPFEQNIKDAYLKMMNVNVICVDWSSSSFKDYPLSKYTTPNVAVVVSLFIDRLSKELGSDNSKLHVIGHSLGAHIAGMAARQVTAGKISRVTGLDPAEPLFNMNDINQRLGSDSADFVEVIHSGGKKLGIREPLGHVDLYPNGGDADQPGCIQDIYGACSHGRSFEIFHEAILNPHAFVGFACKDWNTFTLGSCYNSTKYRVGEKLNHRARGSFYFRTAEASPFGLGKNQRTCSRKEEASEQE